MEPENHPLEKEKHLPNPHFWSSMLVFGRVIVILLFILQDIDVTF